MDSALQSALMPARMMFPIPHAPVLEPIGSDDLIETLECDLAVSSSEDAV